MATLDLVVNGAFSLGGVVVGSVLARLAGRSARKEERTYQEQQRLRESQEEAAAFLDEALIRTNEKLPRQIGTIDALIALGESHDEWQSGWLRSVLVTDPDIKDRYRCVGLTLFWAYADESIGLGANLYIIGQAIDNARRGIGAWRLRQQSAPRTFPQYEELAVLAPFKGQSRDYTKLLEWLQAHFRDD